MIWQSNPFQLIDHWMDRPYAGEPYRQVFDIALFPSQVECVCENGG
jgi:hypothetical protein